MKMSYEGFTYYPSYYSQLPQSFADLDYILKNCPPTCYKYGTDFDKLVAYLCNPQSAYNLIFMAPTYIAGTNLSNDTIKAKLNVSLGPTKTFRQVLLALADNPNSTKAAQYEAIMQNWINRTLYTDPANNVPYDKILHIEFFNCVCVVALSYIQIKNFIQNKDVIEQWIEKLLYILNNCGYFQYMNNISMTGQIARIACAYILGKPLSIYSQYYNDFMNMHCTSDGFLSSESRENATIIYHNRFLIMFLIGQCLLYQSNTPVLSKPNQALLKKVLDNLKPCIGTSPISPPSFFHQKTQWKQDMSPISQSDFDTLMQMYEYVYGTHTTSTLKNTKWFWSSLTFGDLSKILNKISLNPGPVIYLPNLLCVEVGTSITINLNNLSNPVLSSYVFNELPTVIQGQSISPDSVVFKATSPCTKTNIVLIGDNKYKLYIPISINKMIQIRHPNGMPWRYDKVKNQIRLKQGDVMTLSTYDSPDVYNNAKKRVGLKYDNMFVRHMMEFLKVGMLIKNNFDFAWELRSTGEIYNDYAGGKYIGYDATNDCLVMVFNKDVRKVKWVYV